MRERKKYEGPQLKTIIDAMVDKIAARHSQTSRLAVAGVANGGLTLGRRLAEALSAKRGDTVPFGVVNIAFQRDDIGKKPIPLDAENTDLPFDMDEAVVILVDDVFYSGRTARAAMNELFDQGRPAALELAVLCDRGHRKLPIRPDYAGLELHTADTEEVEVFLDAQNPENDRLRIFES